MSEVLVLWLVSYAIESRHSSLRTIPTDAYCKLGRNYDQQTLVNTETRDHQRQVGIQGRMTHPALRLAVRCAKAADIFALSIGLPEKLASGSACCPEVARGCCVTHRYLPCCCGCPPCHAYKNLSCSTGVHYKPSNMTV